MYQSISREMEFRAINVFSYTRPTIETWFQFFIVMPPKACCWWWLYKICCKNNHVLERVMLSSVCISSSLRNDVTFFLNIMSLQIKEISNQFLPLCKEFYISYYTHQSVQNLKNSYLFFSGGKSNQILCKNVHLISTFRDEHWFLHTFSF